MALLREKRRGYKDQVDSSSKTMGIRFRQVKTLEHRADSLQKESEKSAKEDKNREAGYEAENKIPQGSKHKSAHSF
jgi:hypothetical protein